MLLCLSLHSLEILHLIANDLRVRGGASFQGLYSIFCYFLAKDDIATSHTNVLIRDKSTAIRSENLAVSHLNFYFWLGLKFSLDKLSVVGIWYLHVLCRLFVKLPNLVLEEGHFRV